MRITSGSSVNLANTSLNISADRLTVSRQTSATPLLSVTDRGLSIEPLMEVTGPLGVSVEGPLEANQIQSPANQDLQIQSLSGELQLTGGQGVRIEDGVGFDGVEVTSHSNLAISSQTGQVIVSLATPSLTGEGLNRGVSTSLRYHKITNITCACMKLLHGGMLCVVLLSEAGDLQGKYPPGRVLIWF
jgi:hypothetical protein